MHNTNIINKMGTYTFRKSVRPHLKKWVSLFGKTGVPSLILHFCLSQQPIAAQDKDYAQDSHCQASDQWVLRPFI